MDRLIEMEAFATVVDQGGFTDAARKMGISKSAVSKHFSGLETRLGARSLNRTTRRASPTEIGLAYYDRARRVLNDSGEADALVSSMQSAPTGMLRVSVATDFGSMHLLIISHRPLHAKGQITGDLLQNHRFHAAVLFTPFWCLIAGPWGQICNSLGCDARFLNAVF